MDDDFNTARAMGDVSEVFRLANEILDKPGDAATDGRTLRAIHDGLSAIADVLGVFNEDPDTVLRRIEARKQGEKGVDPAAIQALIDERNAARAARNFKRADEIRDELLRARYCDQRHGGGYDVERAIAGREVSVLRFAVLRFAVLRFAGCCSPRSSRHLSLKRTAAMLSFGVGSTYVVPKEEIRVDGRLQYGLSQFLSLRGSAGAGFSEDGTRALLSAGLVYAYDVVTWVPELGVYGGVSLGDGYHHGRVLTLAGVRRYLSRTTSIAVSAGAEYDWAPVRSRPRTGAHRYRAMAVSRFARGATARAAMRSGAHCDALRRSEPRGGLSGGQA